MYSADFTPEQNSVNQQLFEDQQQTLEAEVERLSGLVQRCSETLTINADVRRGLQTRVRKCPPGPKHVTL